MLPLLPALLLLILHGPANAEAARPHWSEVLRIWRGHSVQAPLKSDAIASLFKASVSSDLALIFGEHTASEWVASAPKEFNAILPDPSAGPISAGFTQGCHSRDGPAFR
jgi:hypothetical protein